MNYSGDRRFRNCETGKPAGAKDLALDKICASKYSYNLGGVVQRRGKVTEKWRRKTMGICRWGEESRAAVWLFA